MGATIQLEVSGMNFSPDLRKVLESLTEEDKKEFAKELLRKCLTEKTFHTEWVEAEIQHWATEWREKNPGKRLEDYDIRRYREQLESPVKQLRAEFISKAFEMAKSECTAALQTDENVEFFRQVKEQLVKSMPELMVATMTNTLLGMVAGAAQQSFMLQNNLMNFNNEMNEIRSRLGMPMKNSIGG
jgi:uncharacterized membrane-anchored protein YjiN (DUF445 family)